MRMVSFVAHIYVVLTVVTLRDPILMLIFPANIAIEGFTCLLVFKNIFSFGLTYSGYDWVVSYGIRPLFIVVGSVQVGICCLTVLTCTYMPNSPTAVGSPADCFLYGRRFRQAEPILLRSARYPQALPFVVE